MYCTAIATSLPRFRMTQPECWEMLVALGIRERLTERSVNLLEKVLLRGKSGIGQRHFMIEEVERLWDAGPEELNQKFEDLAPVLGEEAVRSLLRKANMRPEDLDGLLVCTCTGYLCPGLSSFIAERLGLPRSTLLNDLVGMGCGAAIPTMRLADLILQAQPHLRIACLALEVCSAAFYLDNDPGVLISACLFGDGAAASLWTGERDTGLPPPRFQVNGFESLHWPQHRESLRFENAGGKLRNRLHKSVPEVAAEAVSELLADRPLGKDERLLVHPGGRDVLLAVEKRFPEQNLTPCHRVLKECGNMSSPSILFCLEDALQGAEAKHPYRLISFGAGFTAYQCRITPTEEPIT